MIVLPMLSRWWALSVSGRVFLIGLWLRGPALTSAGSGRTGRRHFCRLLAGAHSFEFCFHFRPPKSGTGARARLLSISLPVGGGVVVFAGDYFCCTFPYHYHCL